MHFEAITLLYILNGIELKKKCCCFLRFLKLFFFPFFVTRNFLFRLVSENIQ